MGVHQVETALSKHPDGLFQIDDRIEHVMRPDSVYIQRLIGNIHRAQPIEKTCLFCVGSSEHHGHEFDFRFHMLQEIQQNALDAPELNACGQQGDPHT